MIMLIKIQKMRRRENMKYSLSFCMFFIGIVAFICSKIMKSEELEIFAFLLFTLGSITG